MQEARVKFNLGKTEEFRAILGRLLVSIPKNEFYFEISASSFTMYVYDPEGHQVRLCINLEASFFEELTCINPVVFSMANVRDFFNNIAMSPFQVQQIDLSQRP
jgi:hypothetical protein